MWKQSQPSSQASRESGLAGANSKWVWKQSKLQEPPAVAAATIRLGGGAKRQARGAVESAEKKGCLIHLSGVVKGLAADNSVEC